MSRRYHTMISKIAAIAEQEGFHPVVSFNPSVDKLLQFDLTGNNLGLTAAIYSDTERFCHYIHELLEKEKARYGIGGYGEYRELYSRSQVFDTGDNDEPRRFHLGTDIWGKPRTAVMAPMDGVVHSFAFNNNPGDYGVTIILTHRNNDFIFHTLYGHLSLDSIKNLQEGQHIEKGDVFAEFGITTDNGHWPPHLHFQTILDMGEWRGDYPGVCKYSEKEKWLANSPDPDLILQLNKYLPE